MARMKDSQEEQPESVHLLLRDSSYVGSDVRIYRQLERQYLLYVRTIQGQTVVYTG